MGLTTRAYSVAEEVVSAARRLVAAEGQALVAFGDGPGLELDRSAWALSLAIGPYGAGARKTLMHDDCAAWSDAEFRFFDASDISGLRVALSDKPLTQLDFSDVGQAAAYPFAKGELATQSVRTYLMPYAEAFHRFVMDCAKAGRGMILVTA